MHRHANRTRQWQNTTNNYLLFVLVRQLSSTIHRAIHFANVPFKIYFICLKFNKLLGTMFYVVAVGCRLVLNNKISTCSFIHDDVNTILSS